MPDIDDKIARNKQANKVQDLVNLLDNDNVTGFLVCVTIERKDGEKFLTNHHVESYSRPAKAVFESLRAFRKIYMDDLTGTK